MRLFYASRQGLGKVMNECGYNVGINLKWGGVKCVQIHDLDDSFNNSRVHCSYDLRLQIKQRESFVSVFR